MAWLEEYAELYSERLVRGKLSNARIVSMTGLPLTHAKALAAYCRKGIEPDPMLADPSGDAGEPDEEEGADGSSFLHHSNYVYNEHNDTYVTFLPGVPKPLVLPGEVHREIVRAYSDFAGNPASINEIARTVKLPRPWVVKYLRVHGITHDMEPFTAEEVMSRSDQDLVEDALQIRRATVYKKLEQAKWADIRRDAEKWQDFQEHVLRTLTSAMKDRPRTTTPALKLRPAQQPYAAVVGLTDFHWGKYSDPAENFDGYNRETARKRLFDTTEDVLSRMTVFGAPDKLYVPVGSDFLHIDNDLGTTTRGTVQDMDGTPAEILVTACHLMEEWIQTLAQVGPVELVLMSGNHDRMTGLAILLYLEALFRQDSRVTVKLDRTPRVYRSYGTNLIGFVHGDGVGKTHDLAGHMAREAAQDWARCPNRTIYTGHLHNEKTETDTSYGVTRRQLPSLSGSDRWHSLHGYVGAPKSLPVYLHAKDRGLVAVLHAPAT